MKKEKDRKFNKSDLNLFSVVGNNPAVTSEREGKTFKWNGYTTSFRMWSIADQEMNPWATSSTQAGVCFFSIKLRWKPSRWWLTSALQPCSSWAQWENRLHTAVVRMKRVVSGPAGHYSILHDPFPELYSSSTMKTASQQVLLSVYTQKNSQPGCLLNVLLPSVNSR